MPPTRRSTRSWSSASPRRSAVSGLGGWPAASRPATSPPSSTCGRPTDVRSDDPCPAVRLVLMSYRLVLFRHGESDWNAKNLFTGWVDVDLTEKGRIEAVRGGEQLVAAGLLPDVVHTSLQRRAITTAHLALDTADRHWIPVHRSWRLNERHYGALQGKDKKQTLEQYGEEQFMLWRRSFDVPPPPLDDDNEFSQVGDPRYAHLGDEMPRTECLKDVIARFLTYWESDIVPDLQSRRTVLVAA